MPDFILPCGARKLADTRRYLHRFQIKSDTSDKLYVIAFDRNLSRYVCGCASFIYGRRRPCKHLIRLGLVGNCAPEPSPPRRKRSRKTRKVAPVPAIPATAWSKEDIQEAALEFAEP